MKLNNKILLIFIVFLGIMVLNNSNCFASWENTKEDIPKDIPFYDTFYPKLPEGSYHYIIVKRKANDNLTVHTRVDYDVVYIYYRNYNDVDHKFTHWSLHKGRQLGKYPTYLATFGLQSDSYVANSDPSVYLTGFSVNLSTNTLKELGSGAYTLSFDSACDTVLFSTDDIYVYAEEPFYRYDIEDMSTLDRELYHEGFNFNKIEKELVTIYIDDQNFRKRFKFQLNIPKNKEDTKYYVFLDEFTRNSYDNVKADFIVYTVSTPEDYDYSNYDNYLYYDDLEDGKLYFPAGCTIRQYFVQAENNQIYDLTLEYDFIGERDISYEGTYFDKSDFIRFMMGSALVLTSVDISTLIPTNVSVVDYNPNKFFYNFIKSTFTKLGLSEVVNNEFGYDTSDNYFYHNVLKIFYYASFNFIYEFDDFCCGNATIVSYENERYYSSTKNCKFYDIYRKTKVYNQENKLFDNCYSFNYIDGQDITNMLPEGIDYGYLTSPFYKENPSSISNGFIIYDIGELTRGDKIIDYSKEYNPIHNTFNGDYIENFEEADNIVINNNYTDVIEKTSDEYLLHNIYTTLLEIKTTLLDMNDSLMNTTNNFSYNFEQNLLYWFTINQYDFDLQIEKVGNAAKSHLGIIYQPFEFLIYTATLFAEMDNTTEIALDIPQISFKQKTLIPATYFSFTDYMKDLPILKTAHTIYLTAVDFIILGLLVKLAIKVWKEVFRK